MATYVLVHGSNQGGWIWQPLANRLRAAGHHVYAPSLDGCGERKARCVRVSQPKHRPTKWPS
jgi:alpha-beta hydrolase superfamily lysophospholipase